MFIKNLNYIGLRNNVMKGNTLNSILNHYDFWLFFILQNDIEHYCCESFSYSILPRAINDDLTLTFDKNK